MSGTNVKKRNSLYLVSCILHENTHVIEDMYNIQIDVCVCSVQHMFRTQRPLAGDASPPRAFFSPER